MWEVEAVCRNKFRDVQGRRSLAPIVAQLSRVADDRHGLVESAFRPLPSTLGTAVPMSSTTSLYACALNSATIGLALLAMAAPAVAQQTAAATDESGTAAPAAEPAPTAQGNVFTPDFFARYAPRNALDMVVQIPGFAINEGDRDQRGLGQASGNVLVNGERLASKADSLRDQLSRISAADVVRIEIVDGTALGIPGLSGQVANVIVRSTGASGQFNWITGFRPHNTEPQLYGGEVSLTGSSGKLRYTVALRNNNNRSGADGPILLTTGEGALIERQETRFVSAFDNPRLSTNFTYSFTPQTVANLNLSYGEDFFHQIEPERAIPAVGPVRIRDSVTRENGPEYEIGGDLTFPLGPGRLKLIGLERYERDNRAVELIDRFDGAPATGFRFRRTDGEGERIGRVEFDWRMADADWQVAGEAAFNRLDRVSALFALANDGTFQPIPFPAGTGGVTEDRYEGSVSYSRQLTGTLALQATAGMEYSRIEQTGVAANARSFQRPKGAVSFAWKPRSDLSVAVELARRVDQLSFGDFLASVSLNEEREDGGNNELVPFQSWDVEAEINKGLGAWGSVQLEVRQGWFEDFIDFFPLDSGGEARGNIGNADRTHVEVNALIKLDPLGWRGAQVDLRAIRRWMRVTDPFTGEARPFSNDLRQLLDVDFRRDIPATDWAYGASLVAEIEEPYSRRFEIGREIEGTFLDLFVEHKDVFGLTVNARIGNILGARDVFSRTVFAGSRPGADVLFVEQSDRRIGPIFRFSVSGNF